METISAGDAHDEEDDEDRRDVCTSEVPYSLAIEEPVNSEPDTIPQEMPLPSVSTQHVQTWPQAIVVIVALLLSAATGYGLRGDSDTDALKEISDTLGQVERNQIRLCEAVDGASCITR